MLADDGILKNVRELHTVAYQLQTSGFHALQQGGTCGTKRTSTGNSAAIALTLPNLS